MDKNLKSQNLPKYFLLRINPLDLVEFCFVVAVRPSLFQLIPGMKLLFCDINEIFTTVLFKCRYASSSSVFRFIGSTCFNSKNIQNINISTHN